MLQPRRDFEPLHEPQCNIVTFRYRPERLRDADAKTVGELNQRIRRQIIESGAFYLVQTNLNGGGGAARDDHQPADDRGRPARRCSDEIRRVGAELS